MAVTGASGLTPYEYITDFWTAEPDRFIVSPIHQMPGPNTWRCPFWSTHDQVFETDLKLAGVVARIWLPSGGRRLFTGVLLMHVMISGLCVATLAGAAEVPTSAAPNAAFTAIALSDASLDAMWAGYRLTDGQFLAIGDVAARDQFRFSASVGSLIMDNWWSGEGAELIANSQR